MCLVGCTDTGTPSLPAHGFCGPEPGPGTSLAQHNATGVSEVGQIRPSRRAEILHAERTEEMSWQAVVPPHEYYGPGLAGRSQAG